MFALEYKGGLLPCYTELKETQTPCQKARGLCLGTQGSHISFYYAADIVRFFD